MEVVDNAILLIIPGAMDAGLGDVLFWGSLSFALAIAFVVTVPVNRWLLARGKGHTAVHETGIHGGPDTRIVGAATPWPSSSASPSSSLKRWARRWDSGTHFPASSPSLPGSRGGSSLAA